MKATHRNPVRRPVRAQRGGWRHLGAAAAVALVVPLAACGGGGEDSASGGDDLGLVSSGTLTVCSDVPYPPFDLEQDGAYTGFDGDVVTEIAERLELDLELKDQGFDGLQSGLALNSSQCDMVSAAMTITEERDENIDFSQGYYDSLQSLLVAEGSDIAAIDDLGGARVAVQQGTTGKAYAEENAPEGAELITFPGDAEMYNAIKAGQVDAILQDYPVNLSHQEDGGWTVVEQYDTGEQYGFGFREDGSDALQEAVNSELESMREDGTYDTIYGEYFEAPAQGSEDQGSEDQG